MKLRFCVLAIDEFPRALPLLGGDRMCYFWPKDDARRPRARAVCDASQPTPRPVPLLFSFNPAQHRTQKGTTHPCKCHQLTITISDLPDGLIQSSSPQPFQAWFALRTLPHSCCPGKLHCTVPCMFSLPLHSLVYIRFLV